MYLSWLSWLNFVYFCVNTSVDSWKLLYYTVLKDLARYLIVYLETVDERNDYCNWSCCLFIFPSTYTWSQQGTTKETTFKLKQVLLLNMKTRVAFSIHLHLEPKRNSYRKGFQIEASPSFEYEYENRIYVWGETYHVLDLYYLFFLLGFSPKLLSMVFTITFFHRVKF